MNEYAELRERQQKEVNNFPLGAAFSNEQFKDMMEQWGLDENDTDKILSIGGGCYIRKSDREAFHEMFDRHHREIKEAIEADKTGDGFIYQMFYYELCNYEYCITGDYSETLEALGLSEKEVLNSPALLHGLKKAMKEAE